MVYRLERACGMGWYALRCLAVKAALTSFAAVLFMFDAGE